MSGRAALAGGLIAAGFASLLFPIARHRPAEVAVIVRGPAATAGPGLDLDGEVAPALADRLALTVDGAAVGLDAPQPPGLHRIRWTARYRGGFERAVGVSQLVGPLQDAAAPSCGVRLIVGQALLDGGPATAAAVARGVLDRELRGVTAFPVGDFARVERLALRWAEVGDGLASDRAARALVGDHGGYLDAEVVLGFARARVEVAVALAPRVEAGELVMAGKATAHLRFRYRAVQWLSDRTPLDRLATRYAQAEVGHALGAILVRPPPIALDGGGELMVDYCPGAPIEIVSGAHAIVPLRVRFAAAGAIAGPIAFGAAPPAPPPVSPGTALAVELDLDALGGVLHQLWATGFLDRKLAASGLLARFDADPQVRALVSVRADGLGLALPPIAMAGAAPGSFRLAAEARLTLHDGARVSPARLYGAATVRLVGGGPALAAEVALAELELTCGEPPGRLTPCYGDLVAAARARADDLDGALGRWLTAVLTELFVARDLAVPGADVGLAITRSRLEPAGPGRIRVVMAAALRAP